MMRSMEPMMIYMVMMEVMNTDMKMNMDMMNMGMLIPKMICGMMKNLMNT